MSAEKITERLNGAQQRQIANRCRTLEPIWCAACARLVRMVTLDGATLIVKESPQTLCQRLENHRLHSIQTQTGSLFICFNSLS
jgi:hypothetical protein